MTSFIHTIGMNFKSAPLERVAQIQWHDADAANNFLMEVRQNLDIEEAFFLQTCNRREFYFFAPDYEGEPGTLRARFLDMLAQSLEIALNEEDFYHHRDRQATLHLFRVASSLDSMVLGETEIMKQIKDQSARARQHGHVSRRLGALLEIALRTGRRVRSQTKITKNVVSMASLIYRRVAEARARRIVFVGAGHYIQSIMPTFAKDTELELVFVNRTFSTKLADEYGGTAMSLADFLANPVPFDAMITATGAPSAIFSHAWLAARDQHMLVLDAALPRDVADEALSLPTIDYLDLEHMEGVLSANRAARQAEIPKTEPIFEAGIDKVNAAWLECELSAYSRQISSHYRDTGTRALDHLMKEHLSDLPHDQAEIIRDWTQSLVGKLTNIPILGLKGVAQDLGEPAVNAFTKQVASKSNLFR